MSMKFQRKQQEETHIFCKRDDAYYWFQVTITQLLHSLWWWSNNGGIHPWQGLTSSGSRSSALFPPENPSCCGILFWIPFWDRCPWGRCWDACPPCCWTFCKHLAAPCCCIIPFCKSPCKPVCKLLSKPICIPFCNPFCSAWFADFWCATLCEVCDGCCDVPFTGAPCPFCVCEALLWGLFWDPCCCWRVPVCDDSWPPPCWWTIPIWALCTDGCWRTTLEEECTDCCGRTFFKLWTPPCWRNPFWEPWNMLEYVPWSPSTSRSCIGLLLQVRKTVAFWRVEYELRVEEEVGGAPLCKSDPA